MNELNAKTLEEALDVEGEIVCCSAGISMSPMLRDSRDMVVVEKVNRPLKRHDVPVYRLKSGKIVMHRILKVTDNGYIIRGDHLLNKEFGITDKNIIGVLKGFHRDGRYYDCNKSVVYKLYVFWIRIRFPFRFVWRRHVIPVLSKIKHKLFG